MQRDENEQAPDILYYATLVFPDDTTETPYYFVFDRPAEGVITIKEHFNDSPEKPSMILLKELLYINTKIIPEDAYIMMPTNDQGIEDDYRDPFKHEQMVQEAEYDDPEQAIMAVYPFRQDNDDIMCNAYYMGPFLKAEDEDDFVNRMRDEMFETSESMDHMWLYRPTGEVQEIKA